MAQGESGAADEISAADDLRAARERLTPELEKLMQITEALTNLVLALMRAEQYERNRRLPR